MMKTVLAMTLLLATKGDSDLECGIDGGKAFNDAADAAIYIWAATQRCNIEEKKPKVTGDPCAPQQRRLDAVGCEQRRLAGVTADVGALKPNNAVRCTIDISSAIEAVGSFANVIVGALDKCGVLKTDNKKCGMAAGKLTTAAAGLVAGASGLINSCPNEFQPNPLEKIPSGLETKTNLGKCVVDAKDSLASTFDAMQSLKKITSGKGETEHNALNTVSAFASLGSAVAAAVNDCTAYENGGAGNGPADCTSYVLALVSRLHNVADIATGMSEECKSEASRLYLETADKENASAVTNNSVSLALAAFLPVAAVFGFVSGRRFGKASSNREIYSVGAMPQDELE